MILSIGGGGDADLPLEDFAEIIGVAVADFLGNFRHGAAGFPQKLAGPVHPHLLDVFGDPDAGAGLEQPAEIGGAEGGQGGQGFQGDGLGKVLLNIIEHAVVGGHAKGWAWVLKIVFTAITIGAGFKGGEIVPTFFIGATFGCVVGHLFGLNPGFAAAIGMIAMFCGVLNCPIASIVLSIELFGSKGLYFLPLRQV